ncbi:putative uncharacterized protein DDB_G0282133 isoform X2 [Frieseomelitta varia]|uniref:putative uncharacterized protein DDB_G0282133 isoform X2 n=1 Tax=Frieseomelitta varia TaxID=561572 RepID=UPI001CB68E45|nr:putative uncharacterized protein DDB_G0282133 isoform X2 [Frieseomelitta varia]
MLSPATGSQACITYDAVNRAYIEARKRINVAQPKTKIWRPEDLATVGELLLDISVNLAQTYGLSYGEVEKSLPLIDTSKTLIREVCPTFLSNVECRAGKYRRNDGLCTNLQNPSWGATLSPFQRLMSPRFADGLTAPRISVTSRDLPLSRVVSRTMHPDEGYHDHAGTVMVIAWGQFMDHDYTLTGTPLDPLNRNDPEECCHRPPHLKNPYCNEIHIPEDDYFYRLFGVKCMDFVRAFPAVRPGCRLGSRVPFNLLTGVLDGNTVYGITESFARKLRNGYGGLLRMNPVFSEYGLQDLLPLKLDIPDEGCTRPNRSMYCFEAGEIRVNEQLVLTCMHTLMAREHNRIAKTLIQINPHWDDETLYQEARRIVIAEIQHITYNEFLPILLGKDVMEKFGLLLEKNGYWDGYDENVNPSVIDAFAAAAFRFGHSLLPTAVERWSKAHKFIASKRLSDLIRRPFDLYRAGVFDEYIMGLMNQVAQAMDDSITQEVTNHLFKKAGAKFGLDLVSFNMQRGREFGIPSYMEYRKYCGLPWADSFDDLQGSMPNETIRRYSSIFEHPADVDLWSGGVSERPLPGSMLGPTFACIIATQFSYSRRGDRFWYELPNQPSSFTIDQLNEIRKVKLARVICDNTDLIDTIQIYPMVLPDHEINPRVPCRSGVLPSMDLSKWAEFPAAQYTAERNATRQFESSLTSNWSPTTKTENTRELAKEINKNSPKRIGSKTSWSSKSNTANAFAEGTNNNSTNALNSPTSNGNSNSSENVDENKVEIFENHREETVIGRLRRSLVERSDHVGEQVPSSERFNRHPNLSYEERQKQLNHTMQPRNTNQNLGTARMNKGFDKFESSSSKETNERSCVSVFSDCDDTQNFETSDSKGNREQNFKGDNDGEKDFSQNLQNDKTSIKPKRKNKRIATKNRDSKEDLSESQEIENSQNDKNTSSETFQDRNKSQSSIKKDKKIAANDQNTREKDFPESQEIGHLQNDKNALNATLRDIDKLQSSIKKEEEDKHYIDIRDHQRNVENYEMSSEIPEYDPNKIPYVEVPDYSDIREECLDEEDRKEKTEGKADFVDPEVSIDSKEYSYNDSPEEILELKNSKGNSSEESNSSSSNELDKSKANESNSNVLNLKSVERFDEDKNDTDLTNLNRFSNAGQRDKSDENKSLESLGFGQNSERESLSMDFGESSEFFDREEEDKSELVPTKGSKDNSNDAKYLVEQESEETSREDSTRARQGDSESESGPIIFDVNEYRKPFDLDEFLKDDPIMKKLYQLEKETRTKYGENGKRVPSDFNVSESDNTTFRVRANNAQLRDTFDDLPKSYGSSNFARIDERMRDEEEDVHDDFIRIFRNDKRDFGRRRNHYNQDEETKNDFPKFNFNEGKDKELKKNNKGYKIEKKRGNTRDTSFNDFSDSLKISERYEEDLPTGFGNEDIGNLHEDANVKNHGTKNTRRKEDTRDALSTISSRKSQVSRLDDDQRIKDRDAIGYRNFWSLQHKSPVTRVDMEAQERRK